MTDSQCSNPGVEIVPSLNSYPTRKTKQADNKLKSLLGAKVQTTATDDVPEIISRLFMFHLFWEISFELFLSVGKRENKAKVRHIIIEALNVFQILESIKSL